MLSLSLLLPLSLVLSLSHAYFSLLFFISALSQMSPHTTALMCGPGTCLEKTFPHCIHSSHINHFQSATPSGTWWSMSLACKSAMSHTLNILLKKLACQRRYSQLWLFQQEGKLKGLPHYIGQLTINKRLELFLARLIIELSK